MPMPTSPDLYATRLLLLRHAKSSWDDPALLDLERPLAPRGERDAPRMGAELARLGILPDRVLVSPARRALQTARRFLPAAGVDPARVQIVPELYAAGPDALQRILNAVAGDGRCLLVVGHNPGLEAWGERLTGQALQMPTCALVCIRLDALDRGCLEWQVIPKTLRRT